MAYANGVAGEQRSPSASELLVLEAQKTSLEQRIVYLRQNAAGNGQGLKRSACGPAHHGNGKGPKRAKQGHQDRAEALFQKCVTMLKQLKKSINASPFLKPVDPNELQCFDYFDIVKQPMDLTTVASKLGFELATGGAKVGPTGPTGRVYKSPLEFRDDMQQIFFNCRLYNPENHPIHNNGEKFRNEFEKKWQKAGIEQQWHDLTNSCEAPPGHFPPAASHPTNMSCNTNHRLASPAVGVGLSSHVPAKHVSNPQRHMPTLAEMVELDKELTKLIEKSQASAEAPVDEKTFMPFNLRRQLSRNLDNLPEDKLEEVLKIVSEWDEPSDEEKEKHLDMLDNNCLWKLHHMVSSVFSKTGQGRDEKFCNGGE